jgi:ketosteroid isomerase-like protein
MPENSRTPDLLEAHRRGIEAANRGDYDGAVSSYRPDAVWDNSTTGFGVVEGREAIRGLFEEWGAIFDDFVLDLADFKDFGNGVTFAVLSQRGRPRGVSGLLQQPYGAVTTWKDGLITRVATYADIDEGRAAAERLAAAHE